MYLLSIFGTFPDRGFQIIPAVQEILHPNVACMASRSIETKASNPLIIILYIHTQDVHVCIYHVCL